MLTDSTVTRQYTKYSDSVGLVMAVTDENQDAFFTFKFTPMTVFPDGPCCAEMCFGLVVVMTTYG